jgi:hypothetical protein
MKPPAKIILLALIVMLACKKEDKGTTALHWSEGSKSFEISPARTIWFTCCDTLKVVTFFDAADTNHFIRLAFLNKPTASKQYKVADLPKTTDEIGVWLSSYNYYADKGQYIDVTLQDGHLHFSSNNFRTTDDHFGATPASHYEGTLDLSDSQ